MELEHVLITILVVLYISSSWVWSGVAERWHKRYLALALEFERVLLAEAGADDEALHAMRLAMRDLMNLPGAREVLAAHGLTEELQREMKGERTDGN